MSARRVVAVDGGNSKTDVAILDETGRVLGTHRGPGASFTPLDHDQSIADLERSVRAAAAAAGIDASRSPTRASFAWPAPTCPPTTAASCGRCAASGSLPSRCCATTPSP